MSTVSGSGAQRLRGVQRLGHVQRPCGVQRPRGGAIAAVFLIFSLGWATTRAAGEDAAAAGSSDAQLSEIVVTAQRRPETLQSVPISTQVISGQTLGTQNLNSLVDLSQTVPSVHVSTGAASGDMYIRGIGSGDQQSFDQSVGTFVDDIYHGRARMSDSTFLDVDQVEVLKGPQSTFFGNNAIAGALNIITKKPTQTFDASARVLYGSDGQYAFEGAVGGPVTDTLAVRAAAIVDGGEGWIRDVSTGQTGPKTYNDGGRLSFAFTPSADFDATLKIEGASNRESGDLDLQLVNCPPGAPFTAGAFCQASVAAGVPSYTPNHLGDFEADAPGQGTSLSTFETGLTMNYHLAGQTLTSVTGFYNYHYNQNLELDSTPIAGATVQAPEQYHQFSEELRLASPTGQTLEYLAGAYFQTDTLLYRQDNNFPFLTPTFESVPPFAPLVPYLPISQDTTYSQPEHVYSLFGSASWNVTDSLKLTAGIRGSYDKKDYTRSFNYGTATSVYGGDIPLPAALAPFPQAVFGTPTGTLTGSRVDHDWMPSARIQYRFDPKVMLYASFSQGFKAGGFNGSDTTGIAANLPYQPEYVNAYELGLKSEWLDDTVLMNLDVFRSNYRNLQVVVEEGYATGNGVAVVRNAAASQSQGVEYEGQWVASRNFRISTDVTYLNSRYVSYPDAAPTALQTQEGLSAQNLSGQRTEYAPLWSGSVTAAFTTAIPGNLKFTAALIPFFTSSYYVLSSEDDASKQSEYVRLDARLTLETADGRWALDLIGKNMTDRRVITFATIAPTSPGSYFVSQAEGSNYAAQIRFHW
jgi:iron complex outermembrane receptor protein